jgi:hypothetical protein
MIKSEFITRDKVVEEVEWIWYFIEDIPCCQLFMSIATVNRQLE